MQKMTACALMALLLMMMCAAAQAMTYTYEKDGEVYLTVENFDDELPESARAVFGDLLREGDEALCGTIYWETDTQRDGAPYGEALLAVRRERKTLLMSACRTGQSEWCAAIETDSFFAPEESFSIETAMEGSRAVDAQMVMECGPGRFELWTQENGALNISRYAADDGLTMHCQPGAFSFYRESERLGDVQGILPVRLCAWTSETFPKSLEEARSFAEMYSIVLEDDEGYISSVNLRVRATDQSSTWGKYTARVKILGSRPGRMASWVNVLVGNMTGWVSGVYLLTADSEEADRLHDCASDVHPVGRALRETALLGKPDGAQTAALAEGRLVHVLGEKDGWLHVIAPREELSWKIDWDGTYGFVKESDMAMGVSAADAMWK